MRTVPDLIALYWKWNPKAKPGFGRQWKWAELVPAKDTDRYIGQDFLYQEKENPDDPAYDLIKIPGRAVTLWSVSSGISLYRLNPPTGSNWLSGNAAEEITQLRNWATWIEGGGELYFESERRVREYLEGWGDS